mmetsp:Transcript_34862/g.52012  ORF Transcript_34862/g.52012 Transcript_34862/m.52012 type:complete len:234 (-) Transcript_34862:40-741(-)
MLFPASVIDGLVHQLGGTKLQYECQFHRYIKGEDKACPIGQAVVTSTYSKLQKEYDAIIHTTPPFFLHDGRKEDVVDGLRMCYRHSFEVAFSHGSQVRVSGNENENSKGLFGFSLFSYFSALTEKYIKKGTQNEDDLIIAAVPLLGAGARGFPLDIAIDIAASEAVRWRNDLRGPKGAEQVEKIEDSTTYLDDKHENASPIPPIAKNTKKEIVAFAIPDAEVANMLVQKIESF